MSRVDRAEKDFLEAFKNRVSEEQLMPLARIALDVAVLGDMPSPRELKSQRLTEKVLDLRFRLRLSIDVVATRAGCDRKTVYEILKRDLARRKQRVVENFVA